MDSGGSVESEEDTGRSLRRLTSTRMGSVARRNSATASSWASWLTSRPFTFPERGKKTS